MMDLPPPAIVADTLPMTSHVYSGPAGSRAYRLFVPAAGAGGARPMILMLHGCTQSAEEIAADTRLNEAAGSTGFIAVYPEQPASANIQRCWNWFLPEHQQRDQGEPAVLAGLVREVGQRHAVDERRVYIAGISAGGAMAAILALAYPDVFAAVATHSALDVGAARDVSGALAAMKACGPDPVAALSGLHQKMGGRARMVPLFAVHGLADGVVVPECTRWLTRQFASLAALAGAPLDLQPEERLSAGAGDVLVTRHRDRQGRTVIEQRLVEGLGHAWSGGAPGGRWSDPGAPPVTPAMVEFLLRQTRAP